MRFPRRRVSDADLHRWLDTGAPRRVDRLLDDPEVLARLDAITALDDDITDALEAHFEPGDGFSERTADAVMSRVDDLDRIGTMLGMLGLGFQTWRRLADPSGE